jgi:hypothetical protein
MARSVFLCFVNTEILYHFYASRYKLRKARKSRKRAMKESNNMENETKRERERR